ncbi:5-hydroxytryptamine receptor 2 [Biomphalaria glabrata]|nr:5-hydroxytryptamine receptor 2-like [Biomphalaria glabrata]
MSDIVSDQQVILAMIVYAQWLSPVLQVLAISANILNIIVFYQIGIRDSVNMTFLALSLSDIAYLALDASGNITLIIGMSPWQQGLPVSMYSLSGCVHWYQYIVLDTSTCLETYLAITRCCCVSMPLKFKHVFTPRKTFIIIVCIVSCNIVLRIPLFSSFGLSWQTSFLTNQTKLTFYSSNTFQLFNGIEQVLARTVCPVIFLCISTFCSFILTSALARASVRRKQMIRADSRHGDDDPTSTDKSKPYTQKSANTLAAKEVQLVKAVNLVITLLGILLLSLSLFSLGQAAEPELFPGKKYGNLHGVFSVTANLLIISHTGYKILIYYAFNSRFRCILKTLLHLVRDY